MVGLETHREILVRLQSSQTKGLIKLSYIIFEYHFGDVIYALMDLKADVKMALSALQVTTWYDWGLFVRKVYYAVKRDHILNPEYAGT